MPFVEWSLLCVLEVALVDDVVRHTTGQSRPHLPRQLGLDSTDPNAKLEELLHTLMQACPLVAVPIIAGLEERPATTTGLLEFVGELIQHRFDLDLVALQTLGMKSDNLLDALCFDVLVGVLVVFE